MEWTDQAIVLAVRRHGETSVIAELLTAGQGRHLGLVRGGASRSLRGVLQPGNEVRATWRARLSEHLGNFSRIELERARLAELLGQSKALAGLSAACAVASLALPEREPHAAVHDGLRVLLDLLAAPDLWPEVFVRWELALLRDLGFGLDLDACVATGARTDLAYVSPRSGGAVSAAAAAPYRDRLLPLPLFLCAAARRPSGWEELRQGFTLTGYFLEHHVLAPQNRHLPPARGRMIDLLARRPADAAGLPEPTAEPADGPFS